MLVQLMDKFNQKVIINTEMITLIQELSEGEKEYYVNTEMITVVQELSEGEKEYYVYFPGGNLAVLNPQYFSLLQSYLDVVTLSDTKEDGLCSVHKKSLID